MNANIADQHTARSALDRQLEGVGWALFLIMIGGIELMQMSHKVRGWSEPG